MEAPAHKPELLLVAARSPSCDTIWSRPLSLIWVWPVVPRVESTITAATALADVTIPSAGTCVVCDRVQRPSWIDNIAPDDSHCSCPRELTSLHEVGFRVHFATSAAFDHHLDAADACLALGDLVRGAAHLVVRECCFGPVHAVTFYEPRVNGHSPLGKLGA